MADLTNDTILSTYTTVGSRINDLGVEDGRLIFVRDKHMIALDFDGQRTFYRQIEELANDGARTSLLAPIAGIFYFVVDPGVFWTYQNGWKQLTMTPNDIRTYIDETFLGGEW